MCVGAMLPTWTGTACRPRGGLRQERCSRCCGESAASPDCRSHCRRSRFIFTPRAGGGHGVEPNPSPPYPTPPDLAPPHTIPYHTIPYHAMPSHTMPCHAMPYHTTECTLRRCSPCSTLYPFDLTRSWFSWLANDTAALRAVAPDATLHLDSTPTATIRSLVLMARSDILVS